MSWYVCRTKSNSELLAKHHLENQGYIVYCPMSLVDKRTGKQKDIEPLFCGYVFVQLQPGKDDFHPIRSTRGVLAMVRFGLWPATVSEDLITEMRRHENEQGLHDIQQHDYIPGNVVRVRGGVFNDYLAIVKAKRKDRIIVLIDISSNTVEAKLRYKDLQPV